MLTNKSEYKKNLLMMMQQIALQKSIHEKQTRLDRSENKNVFKDSDENKKKKK